MKDRGDTIPKFLRIPILFLRIPGQANMLIPYNTVLFLQNLKMVIVFFCLCNSVKGTMAIVATQPPITGEHDYAAACNKPYVACTLSLLSCSDTSLVKFAEISGLCKTGC